MKIAIVCDWLVTLGGAEKVLSDMLQCFPQADLFAVVDFLTDEQRKKSGIKAAKTSFIQRLPFAKKKYRTYLPLMPLAIEQFDLSSYDIIISSSHAVAKGVITGPNQIHISYVHSPMRYAWDLQHQYLRESGLDKKFSGIFARYFLHKLRMWDLRSANGVDHFIANSHFIAKRIEKTYRREATVIHPPVDVTRFTPKHEKEDFYLAASRMVPYKRLDLIVEAFQSLPDKKLIVIGEGPEFAKIKQKAGKNVMLLGYQSDAVLIDHLQRAKAFIFAAEEDFGILPLEAQACGTPVIAFGKGGALETVTNETGIFFATQTVDAIVDAISRFELIANTIRSQDCVQHAHKFSSENFKATLMTHINNAILSSNHH